jgi:hypothetical protein
VDEGQLRPPWPGVHARPSDPRDQGGNPQAVAAIVGLAIVAVLVFAKGVEQTAGLVGQKDKLTGHVNTWHNVLTDSGYATLILLAAALAWFLVQGAGPALRDWSRVGASISLMLSFVALLFLSGDPWPDRSGSSIRWSARS